MLKDIDFRKVLETAIAIVPGEDDSWHAYFINTGQNVLRSVLVVSHGYGEVDGKKVETSKLRQLLGDVSPGSYMQLEEIRPDLLPLTNEFWVSYYRDGYLYDKKYVFVSDTLTNDNLTNIPYLGSKGVLIK